MWRDHGLWTVLLLAAAAHGAEAEVWPSRTIRAIVPAGVGGAVDVVPRVVFEELSNRLGQPVVVENRPGGGTTIGSALVAKARPDGYTILATTSALTVSPWVYPRLPYDTVADFSAIIPIGIVPTVLVTAPAKRFKTVHDLVAAAKAQPGALNFTSVGVGSATHLCAERFRVSAGIDARNIPVKSGAEALTEVISGRIDFYFCPIGPALPFIRDGELTALVVSGARRAASLPEVQTLSEAGFADADYLFWLGLFAPARTPRDIIEKLHRETAEALAMPGVRAKLTMLGVDPMPMSPAEFDTFVKHEIAANAALVKSVGLQPAE